MTFHEFIKSVSQHIDDRVTGLSITDEGGKWIVKVMHGNYFAGYTVNKAKGDCQHRLEREVDARLDNIGKNVAEVLNDRLFLEEPKT